MVFEDESSDDESSLPYMHSCNCSADGLHRLPVSVEDPDYHGLELDTMVFCEKHGRASKRHVAFEGTYTGRRFLACAEPKRSEKWKQTLESEKGMMIKSSRQPDEEPDESPAKKKSMDVKQVEKKPRSMVKEKDL